MGTLDRIKRLLARLPQPERRSYELGIDSMLDALQVERSLQIAVDLASRRAKPRSRRK